MSINLQPIIVHFSTNHSIKLQEELVLPPKQSKPSKISSHPKDSEEYKIDKKRYMREYRNTHKDQFKVYKERQLLTGDIEKKREMQNLYAKRYYHNKKHSETNPFMVITVEEQLRMIRDKNLSQNL
jgi:hypothetical protein